MPNPTLIETLYDKALHFLGFRPRSKKEIRTYLKEKINRLDTSLSETEQEKLVDKLVTRLARAGFIDDSQFSKWWIQQRQQCKKPKGKRLIAAELYRKGIDSEMFEQMWRRHLSTPDSEPQEALSVKLAQQKLSTLSKSLNKLEKKKRISDYLARRGFAWQEISSALNALTIS